MTTEYRVALLEQVQKLCDINKTLLTIANRLGPKQCSAILDISDKIISSCDLLTNLGASPSVDIKTEPQCPS